VIRLQSCRKAYSKETQRSVPPEETLRRARELLPAAGITRVADITSLDRVGIPVFSSIRPNRSDRGDIGLQRQRRHPRRGGSLGDDGRDRALLGGDG